jgi:hypothetical protein
MLMHRSAARVRFRGHFHWLLCPALALECLLGSELPHLLAVAPSTLLPGACVRVLLLLLYRYWVFLFRRIAFSRLYQTYAIVRLLSRDLV